MPELPEIQTIINNLRPILVGCSFLHVQTKWKKSILIPVEEFRNRLIGEKIQDIERRGKYLCFRLSSGEMLILHLKMSGDLLVVPASEPISPYDRTIFELDSGYQLRFRDARKFGRIYLESSESSFFSKLGPEPLDAEFSPEVLGALLSRHTKGIKSLLLDQAFIAGVGNIYANEALFVAGIRPERRANSLKREEIAALHAAIRNVLLEGIRYRGASLDKVYRGGEFQNHFHVYDRKGAPCQNCGSPIIYMRFGNRGTYYCEYCQK